MLSHNQIIQRLLPNFLQVATIAQWDKVHWGLQKDNLYKPHAVEVLAVPQEIQQSDFVQGGRGEMRNIIRQLIGISCG